LTFVIRLHSPDCLPRRPHVTARRALPWLLGLWLALLAPLLVSPAAARATAVEVLEIDLRREDGAVNLDVGLRLTLPPAIEDALQRGVPLYFVAHATLLRPRWYWRDERVARASRTWRLSYQPLAGSYRVTLGGLHQTYSTLPDALLAVTRLSGWRIADPGQAAPGRSYELEFSWQLDITQLPPPMQIGIGGSADWVLGVERIVPLPP
jgi:Domain of unknown function (DUF4390)